MGFRRRCASGRGQALVEFALVLPLLMLVLIGMLEFGKAVNYWINQNQLASEGARWVAVNKVPRNAGQPATDCTTTPVPQPDPTLTMYKDYIRCQAETGEMKNLVAGSGVKMCFLANNANAGSPVKVTLTSNYPLIPIVKIGSVTIKSHTTMRLEQTQTGFSSGWDTGC